MRADDLKVVLGLVSEGVVIHDADGAIVDCNAAAARLLGCSQSAAVGMSGVLALGRAVDHSGSPLDVAEEPATLALKSGRTIERRRVRFRAAGTEEVLLELSAAPLGNARRLGSVAAVTLLREVPPDSPPTDQARGRHRMEAMGRLAGSVAHDFNNLLTVILGYTSMLLDGLDPADDRWREADEVRKAAQRGADLTKQLLAISRGQVVEARVLDVNVVLLDMLPMLRQIAGAGITIDLCVHSDVAAVRADLGQLEQLIMNLVINARDAMPSGGKVEIRIDSVELDERFVSDHPGSRTGQFVRIEVQDDGCGMDEATRQRIFEPFFTTKAHDKGTGLGLATVYGIVKQHGGYIDVQSRPGHGATFHLYLPLRIERPDTPRPARRKAPLKRGVGRVLLVIGDDQVRRFTRRVLLRSGFEVLDEANAARALARAEGESRDFDVLIADLVMQGLGGVELARRLLARRPRTRVLFLSGYAEGSFEATRLTLPSARLLAKPFRPDALLDELRTLLATEARSSRSAISTS